MCYKLHSMHSLFVVLVKTCPCFRKCVKKIKDAKEKLHSIDFFFLLYLLAVIVGAGTVTTSAAGFFFLTFIMQQVYKENVWIKKRIMMLQWCNNIFHLVILLLTYYEATKKFFKFRKCNNNKLPTFLLPNLFKLLHDSFVA